MLKKSALLLCAFAVAQLQGAVTFVNGIAIPGDTGDAFGNSVNDGRLGFFSDLYYDQIRGEWWGLSDRGPGGGTLNYDTRIQLLDIGIDPNTGAITSFQVVDTIKFHDANGDPFDGIAPSPSNILGNAFDPEGIVIHPTTGNMFVSDEYGPSVYEFDRTGLFIRAFTTPANIVPRDSATNTPSFAGDPAANAAGKRTNRGFEGLAISPDGKYVFAMLQSAMLDEGAGNGVFNRIVKFDAATGQAVAQYAYRLEGSSQGRGQSALVALNDNQFLVLERNNRGIGVGADATPPNKKVFLIDITGATDVSGIDLDSGASFTTVVKEATVFLDLTADTLAAIGNKVPEKWEGLTFGPKLNDGSFVLLAGTDNDYSVTQNGSNIQFDVYFRFSDADPYATSIQCPLGTTVGCFLTSDPTTAAVLTQEYQLLPGILHAYKVSMDDPALRNYVAPYVVPEPGTWSLLLIGAGAVLLRRRRS